MGTDDLAMRHLLLRLRPITRALRAAAARQAQAAARLDRPDLTGVCVTDQHVADLLDDVTAVLEPDAAPDPGPSPLTAEEVAAEEDLRREAAGRGLRLPLDRLAKELGLTMPEQEALLCCAAVEIDRGYERIIGYILDDLRRPFPCTELLCHLTAGSTAERFSRRHVLGRFGRLRRCRLLEPFGEITTDLRTFLRLGAGVLEFLMGAAPAALELWQDPADGEEGRIDHPGLAADLESLTRLGFELADETVGVIGIWGRSSETVAEAVSAVARAAGRPLRHLLDDLTSGVPAERLREAVLTAAVQGAVLHVPIDPLQSPELRAVAAQLTGLLATCSLPTILTGAQPWRPARLLTARSYAEVELLPAPTAAGSTTSPVGFASARRRWRRLCGWHAPRRGWRATAAWCGSRTAWTPPALCWQDGGLAGC